MHIDVNEISFDPEQGQSLEELLEYFDLTPLELAAKCGVSTLVVNGILDGITPMTDDLAKRFATVLKMASSKNEAGFRIGIETPMPG